MGLTCCLFDLLKFSSGGSDVSASTKLPKFVFILWCVLKGNIKSERCSAALIKRTHCCVLCCSPLRYSGPTIQHVWAVGSIPPFSSTVVTLANVTDPAFTEFGQPSNAARVID